ncbi:hypothetical protein AB0H12_23055 [Actinosynnema sp. NPDC023794]
MGVVVVRVVVPPPEPVPAGRVVVVRSVVVSPPGRSNTPLWHEVTPMHPIA